MAPFSYRRTLLLGLGFFGITLITSLYDALLPLILQGFGIAASLIGFVMTFDNYAALFLQPWAGARSDQTQTRLGRRIPFILIGAPLGALGFSLMPLMPTFPLLLGAVLLTNLSMALFRSPTIALLGDIFPSEQRSQANGVINFMGTLAGALALFAGGALFRQARALPFWTASLGMLVALSLLILLVKEARRLPEGVEPEKEPGLLDNLREVLTAPDKSALLVLLAIFCWTAGQNSVQTFFTLFATNVLGLEGGRATQMLTVYAGAGLVFAIPGGLIAARYGRRRVVMVCLVILTVLFLGAFFVANVTYVLVMLVLAGAAFTTIIVNALPMTYDAAPGDRIGAYTGLYYLFGSLAAIVGPPLAGVLVDATGSYRAIFLFGPVFMALALLLMSRARGVEARITNHGGTGNTERIES